MHRIYQSTNTKLSLVLYTPCPFSSPPLRFLLFLVLFLSSAVVVNVMNTAVLGASLGHLVSSSSSNYFQINRFARSYPCDTQWGTSASAVSAASAASAAEIRYPSVSVLHVMGYKTTCRRMPPKQHDSGPLKMHTGLCYGVQYCVGGYIIYTCLLHADRSNIHRGGPYKA